VGKRTKELKKRLLRGTTRKRMGKRNPHDDAREHGNIKTWTIIQLGLIQNGRTEVRGAGNTSGGIGR